MTDAKRYDRAYFDRFYRGRAALRSPAELARQVALVLAITESVIGRPVRHVLDVGCGEGAWRAPLLRQRRAIEYTGVDPSEYAIRRHGHRRNLMTGSLGQLASLPLRPCYDLVIANDVLHYLDARELKPALAELRQLTDGVAWLQLRSSEEDIIGDVANLKRLPARRYRTLIERADFIPLGLQCYVPSSRALDLSPMDLIWYR
jgi:SAM-dependent methyltransferase